MNSYNSSQINPAEVVAFKAIIFQWFVFDCLTISQKLALAMAFEEAAVEIRQSAAVNDAAKNQIS